MNKRSIGGLLMSKCIKTATLGAWDSILKHGVLHDTVFCCTNVDSSNFDVNPSADTIKAMLREDDLNVMLGSWS